MAKCQLKDNVPRMADEDLLRLFRMYSTSECPKRAVGWRERFSYLLWAEIEKRRLEKRDIHVIVKKN